VWNSGRAYGRIHGRAPLAMAPMVSANVGAQLPVPVGRTLAFAQPCSSCPGSGGREATARAALVTADDGDRPVFDPPKHSSNRSTSWCFTRATAAGRSLGGQAVSGCSSASLARRGGAARRGNASASSRSSAAIRSYRSSVQARRRWISTYSLFPFRRAKVATGATRPPQSLARWRVVHVARISAEGAVIAILAAR
jgi:hypothetical protein